MTALTRATIFRSFMVLLAAILALEERPASLGASSPFELDGNATSVSATTQDWDKVFANASGAATSQFLTDPVNSKSDDIFKGGGAKDSLGIQQGPWLFADGKPEPPFDIAHAYVAAYVDPANQHFVLYAGLDRFDHSEDAIISLWLLKNPLDKNATVTLAGGHPFVGTHADGDILVASVLTMAGSSSTPSVFRWTGDDATGTLVAVNAGSNVRAIVNSATISVPWPFQDKKGATSPAAGEFLEEGVDLTALGAGASFTSFVVATRSSEPTTSTNSDFVMGSLLNLAAPPFLGLSKVGDPITYLLTVQNASAVPLYVRNITDTRLGNIVVNGAVQAPVAPVTSIDASALLAGNPLAPGASGTVFVTRIVPPGDPDPAPDTVSFVYNTKADFSGGQATASATNSVNLFQPSATLTVTASPTTAQTLGAPITYTYTVTNTSSADSPNLVLSNSPDNSFTDSLLGDLKVAAITAGGGSVAPGATFSFTRMRSVQAGDPTPLTNTGTAIFTVAQNLGNFNNQITAQASASVTLLPHLTITKAVSPGGGDVVHPGDTASFAITVTNNGAGPSTNVVVSDQLPRPDVLTWSATSSTFTTSVSPGGFLTATAASLAAGASASITVSAVVPIDLFPVEGGIGNGNPLPSGIFELDGNANDDAATGEDWSNIWNSVVFGGTTRAFTRAFVTDAVNSNADDIFTGGGSKDTVGIQSGPWLFTGSKPQGKNDVTHAFAALYRDPAFGDWVVYTGMDRFDNSGDATSGFWLFKNPIGQNPNVTINGGHPFTGTHADGDILFVSDFTIGASVSRITVFRWTGDDATGSLVPLTIPNPNSTATVVNGSAISVPWSYTNKSGQTQPDQGEFLEQGVNLTALGLTACFSSFLAETRSSQSPTATLSDFTIGSFTACSVDLQNTATVSADGINPIASNTIHITVIPN